jgi:ferredoxin
MTNRAEVDHDICTGYAECARMAPSAFALNGDNQSEYVTNDDTSDELLLAAAQECPTNAIRVLSPDDAVVYDSA